MKVKTETIIRTIVLILALANQVPITEDDVYQTVTISVTVGSALWAWWKNNSFTGPAIEADEYMEKLREEK